MSGRPVEVSQVVAIFLMSVTSSSRKGFSRKWRSVWAEVGACRFFSKGMVFSVCPGLCPTHLGAASVRLKEGHPLQRHIKLKIGAQEC